MDPWLLEFSNWITEEEEANLAANVFINTHLQQISVGKLQQLSILVSRQLRKRVRCSFCHDHLHAHCQRKENLVHGPKLRGVQLT